MKLLRSCAIAFSMYSKLPVPQVRWEQESMEYMFCFFPLVGAVSGVFLLLWWKLAELLLLTPALTAAVCVVLPLLITGGIHMDGFCDTADALASNQNRERRLEILKDPCAGVFAVIACAGYLLLQFGVWYQGVLSGIHPVCILLIPVLSRTLSGIAAVTRKNARGSGLLAVFTQAQAGQTVRLSLGLWLAVCVVLLLYGNLRAGGITLLAAAGTYLYYYRLSEKEFGGITGDLAGWFLQLCELSCLLCAVLLESVVAVL